MRWKVPEGIRPTTQKTCQTLFNTLRSHFGSFEGRRVLDLCAGSGAIGLTALREGFEGAVLVERVRLNCSVISTNASRLKLLDRTEIICSDVLKLKTSDLKNFDLIFLDPPYELETSIYLAILGGYIDLLSPGGLMVVEYSRRNSDFLDRLDRSSGQILKRKEIGETELVFLNRKDQPGL